MSNIAVWKMIQEAVTSIGTDAISMAEIRKYIFDHYGTVNEGTINAQALACCVNRQSRVSMPENNKPHIANDKYDFLYSVSRGVVTLYDPKKHGVWEIAEHEGKLVVRQTNESINTNPNIGSYTTRILRTVHRTRTLSDFEHPSRDAVECYIEKWNTLENYKAQESALSKLFKQFSPENNSLDDVLLKVAALNAFYSTNIYNVFAVARHIVSLNIDDRLKRGDESLVMDIASGHGVRNTRNGKELRFYSFATKYCSHHQPEVYPIYDSFVEELLVYLRDVDNFANFHREDLRNISVFKKTLLKLQAFYSLENFTLKEIDQYLWQYGKEKFPKKY